MTYPTYDAREITYAVLDRPELARRWKQAAEHNLIKAVGLGRYSAVLDDELARELRTSCPDVVVYVYNERDGRIELGPLH